MSSKGKHAEVSQADGTGACDRCLSMTSSLAGMEALQSDHGYEHLNEAEMRASADDGCPVCEMLLNDLIHEGQTTGPLRVAAIPSVSTEPMEQEHKLGALLILNGYFASARRKSPHVKLYTISEVPASALIKVLPGQISVSGDLISRDIRNKLKTCRLEHETCGSGELPILPRRLIDVCTGDPTVLARIYHSKGEERGDYTALSYCWGGSQEFVTTLDSLDSFSASLPVEILPKTIKDAIQVTRDIGIRFLWVDSLCIIQDSVEDKALEIDAMGSIYKKATITIAAGNALRAVDGFLQDRAIPNATSLPIHISPDQVGKVWLAPADKQCVELDPSNPLENRGWALQENLLSSRLLYYGSRDLLWRCQARFNIAVHPTHSFYYEKRAYAPLPTSIFHNDQRQKQLQVRPSQQTKVWEGVIQDYARRDLTIFEDRLPALAGIASELQRVWGDAYLAGMWRQCLILHLAWFRYNVGIEGLPLERLKSPSWSWASSQGSVNFPINDGFEEDAEVLDVNVIPVDARCPFGRVRSGTLRLRASVRPWPDEIDARYCYMDIGPDGLHVADENCLLLLLGRHCASRPRFLIIAQAPVEYGSDTFMRIGAGSFQEQRKGYWDIPNRDVRDITII